MKLNCLFLLFVIGLFACNETPSIDGKVTDSTSFVSNDTIPEIRSNPSKKPIAVFEEKVGDDVGGANNWKFAVRLYETPKTFTYKLTMQYKEIIENTEINIPNFGTYPKPECRNGDTKNSCIVGFLDKKGVFKPYKKISATNDRLKLTTLHHYSVGVYRTQIK